MPHGLGIINAISSEFSCFTKSAIHPENGVHKGRPYGGTAILVRSNLFTQIENLQCDSDRIIAVRLVQGNRNQLVFCVYMPTNANDNFPEFIHCLALISAVIESANNECVLVLGDFNAHPGTLFGKELLNYCNEQSLPCIDIDRLDSEMYIGTYVSEATARVAGSITASLLRRRPVW